MDLSHPNARFAAQDILARPSATWAAGPRRPPLRRAFSILTAAALFASVGAGAVRISSPEWHAYRVHAPAPSVTNPSVHWVDMPTTPFIEAGRSSDGWVSGRSVLSAWKRAGMSPEQALKAMEWVQAFSPVVMARVDPALEKRLRQEALAADVHLQEQFPAAYRKLKSGVRPTGKPLGAEWEPVLIMWQSMGPSPSPVKRIRTRETPAHARALLSQAASETGLRALRVAWPSWQGPNEAVWLAKDLQKANRELQAVSGWSSQVLGLDGRVVLRMGAPDPSLGANGITQADERGVLWITADWKSLGHEWIHAVDTLAGRVIPVNSDGDLLSRQSTWRLQRDYGTAGRWREAAHALEKLGPSWTQAKHRATAAETAGTTQLNATASALVRNGYWLDRAETIAFAFSAHIARRADVQVLADPDLAADRDQAPERYPTETEIRAQNQVWAPLFRSLDSWGFGEPALPADVNQWRNVRHGPVAKPAVSQPRPK